MRSLQFCRIVASFVCLFAIAAPFVAADQPAPININVILPLTGNASFSGAGASSTLKVFEDEANRTGGVQGRPIHFLIGDDQSQAQVAVQLMNQAIAQHPAVIIGSIRAETCGAMAPLVAAHGPVMYCLSPGVNPPKGSYVFSSAMTLDQWSKGMIRYLRLKGYKRVAHIASIDASGHVSETGALDALALPENKSLQTVADEHFNTSDVDVAAQLARIKAAQPDVIAIWTAGAPFATVLRGLRDAGLDNIPIITSGANSNGNQLASYASFLPSNLILPGFAYNLGEDGLKQTPLRTPFNNFIAAFQKAGQAPQPDSAPYVWDAATMILNAYRKYGPSMSADQLRGSLMGIDKNFVGIDGVYDFSTGDQHGLTSESVVMIRFDPEKKVFIPVSKLGGTPL